MTERKEANAVYPSSVAGGLLQHVHSFSVQCTVSFDKKVIMTKNSQSMWHKRQSGLCLPYRKWTWLCTVKHATATLQRPQSSSSSSLREKAGKEGRDHQSLVSFFKSCRQKTVWRRGWSPTGDNKIVLFSSTLAGAQLLLPSACSGSCRGTFFFWEWPPANCNSGHKRSHHTGALHSNCPQGIQKLCWAQLKLSSALLQCGPSACSNSEPVSISSSSSSRTYYSCKTRKKKGKNKKNTARF